jgi:hypothetical protein
MSRHELAMNAPTFFVGRGVVGDDDVRVQDFAAILASWKKRARKLRAGERRGRGDDRLQGNLAGEHGVVAAVHDSHGSPADAAADLVPPQRGIFQETKTSIVCGSQPLYQDEPRPVWYDRWKPTTLDFPTEVSPMLSTSSCARCGYELTGAGDFCSRCGAPQAAASWTQPVEVAGATMQSRAVSGGGLAPGKKYALIVVQGEESGRVIPIEVDARSGGLVTSRSRSGASYSTRSSRFMG